MTLLLVDQFQPKSYSKSLIPISEYANRPPTGLRVRQPPQSFAGTEALPERMGALLGVGDAFVAATTAELAIHPCWRRTWAGSPRMDSSTAKMILATAVDRFVGELSH